ncbi:FAD-dependent oxidoreductase [Microbacterium trichothecenolyticum]|uniref:FAD-dependent oxidoreductase n=1 Tax=Microbacterium ureisolvens TaxID=2781186 RepID=A0ABS7I2K3_9MICO|nr:MULTISPECIES: FAD-dependent oxidoreductase [Microbacterium]MBW9111892.1 FAD-dependent oxidoreductase [Microbacterium ureisolvens]MBW9122261.1 FAD-dependent oxidoreductase [Microbacterium trichothecenolyticum]
MKVVVIGAGVIGVTSAYYLAKDGHEVTVLDQSTVIGNDATGGNAGLIAPGHSFAWASPAAPKLLVSSLLGEKTSIRMRFPIDRQLMLWGVQFLRECTPGRAKQNTLVKLRLAQYSQQKMDELAEAESIDYQQARGGAVYLYRSAEELAAGAAKMQFMQDNGQDIRTLGFDDIVDLDPAFAPAHRIIAGGLYAPTDAAGNSKLFTDILAERCRDLGVTFDVGVTALRFQRERLRAVSLSTNVGDYRADQFIVANGINAPFLASSLGQRLPVYPAKGYSLTAPVADPDKAPSVPGVDEKTLVAWSRMGDELRMSSTAEFVGYDRQWKPSDFSNILSTGKEMFPEGVRWDEARMRSCLRPMTPDGPPIIGRSSVENVYYNTGHGHMGWTMAVGSSLMLRDLLRGRTPTLEPEPMRVRSFTFA